MELPICGQSQITWQFVVGYFHIRCFGGIEVVQCLMNTWQRSSFFRIFLNFLNLNCFPLISYKDIISFYSTIHTRIHCKYVVVWYLTSQPSLPTYIRILRLSHVSWSGWWVPMKPAPPVEQLWTCSKLRMFTTVPMFGLSKIAIRWMGFVLNSFGSHALCIRFTWYLFAILIVLHYFNPLDPFKHYLIGMAGIKICSECTVCWSKQ